MKWLKGFLGQVFAEWDFIDSPDKPAPTVLQAVYREFALLVYSDELGDDLAHSMLNNWYFWQERLQKMVLENNSSWFDNVKTANKKETRDDLFHQAALIAAKNLASTLGSDPAKWLWGKVHVHEFVSPIRRSGAGKDLLGGGSHAASGSGETLYRGMYDFSKQNGWIVFDETPEKIVHNIPKVLGPVVGSLNRGEGFSPRAYVSIVKIFKRKKKIIL